LQHPPIVVQDEVGAGASRRLLRAGTSAAKGAGSSSAAGLHALGTGSRSSRQAAAGVARRIPQAAAARARQQQERV
jgi:hypothetical protein